MKNKTKQVKQKGEKILMACIGQCVHVAGTYNFMNVASKLGYQCIFLGPATPNSVIIQNIKRVKPDILGLSYRLTPKTLISILQQFKEQYDKLQNQPKRLFFAGTPEVVKIAKEFEFFHEYFVGGETKHSIISKLKRNSIYSKEICDIPMDLISRLNWKKPYPIVRAHFGLSTMEESINGINNIANSEVLDVISIAPDQNAQSHFFHPDDQVKDFGGAGGMPIRSREDLLKIHKARLTGNFPLLRIYAGTRDFIKLAQLYKETINNAWAAIPIFWFNQMDGRGPLNLEESIKQHLKAIKWYAERDIPIEINDPHHWSLRDAPDVIAVADMYLCGIIAKNLGVKHFIAQYMFNTPPGSSFDMDLAKMLAKDELLKTLENDNFSIIRQVRTGLASFPIKLDKAKGHLAAATMIQLALKPDIIHVVSFSEANHAARPKDIIESCNIVDQVVNKVYNSNLSFINQNITERKEELIYQAKSIIDLITSLCITSNEKKNPWIDYRVLNRVVKLGIFDAPHLRNNQFAKGEISTRIIDGACYSWDNSRNKKLNEIERIMKILGDNNINIHRLKEKAYNNLMGKISE
jgi:hypothetical protein